jgi:hypothetical protein
MIKYTLLVIILPTVALVKCLEILREKDEKKGEGEEK